VKNLAAFLGRSPDTATVEDLRLFQLHLTETHIRPPTINGTVSALRFFFTVTLDRADVAKSLTFVAEPRKIPVILSLEHNFGHGNQNLAMLFAAMNLLAFAFHTVCDCLEDLWIKARNAKRARKRLFEHIRTITAYLVFPSWDTLMTTLINSKPPPEIEKQIWA
jgi:Phage integrase, N-terminal SAM-like domain